MAILILPMSINIKDPATDRLVRELASATGETITEAIAHAARERLDRIQASRNPSSLADDLNEIGLRCAALPVLDARPADEIIGYDNQGLPA